MRSQRHKNVTAAEFGAKPRKLPRERSLFKRYGVNGFEGLAAEGEEGTHPLGLGRIDLRQHPEETPEANLKPGEEPLKFRCFSRPLESGEDPPGEGKELASTLALFEEVSVECGKDGRKRPELGQGIPA